MKISALIPAYRSASTIVASLQSILAQTRQADEIIILLDGVVDETPMLLEPYNKTVTIVTQSNQGIASARNRLAELASGEILAYLDADDLWHKDYLEEQHKVFLAYPEALASFTGHVRFRGADYEWPPGHQTQVTPELIQPGDFFIRYNITTAVFGSMSYLCVRKECLRKIGPSPFSTEHSGVEDSFLCYQMALLGPVVLLPAVLVAYRLGEHSLSANRLKALKTWAAAFQQLEPAFDAQPSKSLARAFHKYYSSKRREYAKTLLGANQSSEARSQLFQSIRNCLQPMSLLKSLALLGASLLPRSLQPKWPSSTRVITQAPT